MLRALHARPAAVLALTGLLALAAIAPADARIAPGPLDADPAGLRVSLALPEGIALLPGSARLNFTLSGMADDAEQTATDLLEADPSAVPGRYELHLADPAGAGLAAVQAAGRAAAAAGKGLPQAAVEVSFTPCLTTPVVATDRPVTLSIRFSPDGPPLQLLPEGTTLAALLAQRGLLLEPCP